jgi:hypothetical protein
LEIEEKNVRWVSDEQVWRKKYRKEKKRAREGKEKALSGKTF